MPYHNNVDYAQKINKYEHKLADIDEKKQLAEIEKKKQLAESHKNADYRMSELMDQNELNNLYGKKYKWYNLNKWNAKNIDDIMNYIHSNFGPFKYKLDAKSILNKFMNDAEFYQLLQKSYTDDIETINLFQYNIYREKQIPGKLKNIKKVLRKALPHFSCEIGTVLDIGTEDAYFLEALQQTLGCESIGLNIESGYSHYIAYDEAVKSGRIVLYDGKKMPFLEDQFGLVLIQAVLHHVQDLETLLAEACRISRNIYIKDNDMSTKTSQMLVDIQHEMYEGVLVATMPSPLYHYRSEQVISILKKYGFEIKYYEVNRQFTRGYNIVASKINST